MFEGMTTDEPLICDHTKCKELVVAYGSWLLTKMEPEGLCTNRPHHASDGRLQRLSNLQAKEGSWSLMKDGLLSEVLDWENFGVFNRWSLARGGCT